MTTPIETIRQALAAATTLVNGAALYEEDTFVMVDHEPDVQSPTRVAQVYNEPIRRVVVNMLPWLAELCDRVEKAEAARDAAIAERDALKDAEQCCIDIADDFSEGEVTEMNRSIGRAWIAGCHAKGRRAHAKASGGES